MNKGISRVYLTNVVTGKSGKNKPAQLVTSDVLRQVARKMLPLYRTVAVNKRFARKWSKAVVETDLDQLTRLLKKVSPRIGTHFPGSNGIGYFISFPFAAPVEQYANGTTIPPGSVQFVFEPQAHQAVAAAVCPLYRALAFNSKFAVALVRAILTNDVERVAALVRSRVKARTLKSIAIDESGLALTFRFSFSKYTYRNLLFRDTL